MIKFETPLAAFLHWENSVPDNIFLRQPIDGKFIERSYKSSGDEIRCMAAGLLSLDIPENSK